MWLGVLAPGWAQTPQGAKAAPTAPALVPFDAISAADTAWLMTATVLVLLMTLPGVALFYAGMVRRKNVLNTMASVLAIAAVVSVWWFVAATPGPSLPARPGLAASSAWGSRVWTTTWARAWWP